MPEFLSELSSTLEACNFIKTETPTHVFSVTFAKFLRTPFLWKICKWLLLKKKTANELWIQHKKWGVTENLLNYLLEKCNKKT